MSWEQFKMSGSYNWNYLNVKDLGFIYLKIPHVRTWIKLASAEGRLALVDLYWILSNLCSLADVKE